MEFGKALRAAGAEAIAPKPGVPILLCFIHCCAYLLCRKEDVLAVPSQGLRVSLFSYTMGSDPADTCFMS